MAPETHDSSPGLRADRYFGPIPLLDDFAVSYEEPAEDAAILRRLGQPAFAREGEDVAGRAYAGLSGDHSPRAQSRRATAQHEESAQI